MKDVYQRLAEFLDTFPQRFPVNTEKEFVPEKDMAAATAAIYRQRRT